MSRETYRQAIRSNDGRPTCTICFLAMRYANPQICDSCYSDLSKAGQLLERIDPCPTNSK